MIPRLPHAPPPCPSNPLRLRDHAGNRRPSQQPRAASGSRPRSREQPAASTPSHPYPDRAMTRARACQQLPPLQQPRASSGNWPHPQGQPAALRLSSSSISPILRPSLAHLCSPPHDLPPPASSDAVPSSACLLSLRRPAASLPGAATPPPARPSCQPSPWPAPPPLSVDALPLPFASPPRCSL